VSTTQPPDDPRPPAPGDHDGFGVLDACHRQTVVALDRLEILVDRLESGEVDAQAKALASEVVEHFSTVARQHHQDEERHVFPRLASSADAETVQAVLRLQQDHYWLEEDWLEMWPHLDAVACGRTSFDLDVLREATAVFVALSRDHIALEESLLYPQARALIGAGERRDMGREMAARRRAERTPLRRTT
jgi:hemerythrin-like domain-containing protein